MLSIMNTKELDTFSDEELILDFQNGNLGAYKLLVKRFKNPLMNYIYNFVNDMQLAEDILQETFLRLYKNKHYYKEIAKFSTWIYTIAGNLARTELRKKKRRTIFSINSYTDDNKDFEIEDSDMTPDEVTHSEMVQHEIREAIAELPESFREAVLLRDVEQLDYDEISKILDKPLGTVKSRINRGRARLAKKLQHLMEE
jgi:RNA polymerase sigma-70 factor (ECF subfamily)